VTREVERAESSPRREALHGRGNRLHREGRGPALGCGCGKRHGQRDLFSGALLGLPARFIFLWIAFTAANAHEFGELDNERRQLDAFFTRLVGTGADGRLQALLFERFSGPIRSLIDNKFVFQPFWRALRDHDSSGQWEESFAKAKQLAMLSVLDKDTVRLLCIVFDRLYVLRCSLVHGGSTWNSQLNRTQVSDGVELLRTLLPTMLELMVEHPGLELGAIAFPVVKV